MKQIISLIILIAIIVILNTITLANTERAVNMLNEDLSKIEEGVSEDEKSEDKINVLEEDWKKYKETLSFYIEHEELEKIESEITALTTNAENEEFETANEGIARAKFLLQHIKEKNELKLKNIF